MITRIYLAAGLLSLAALNTRAQNPWIANPNYPMDTNACVGSTVSFRVIASTTNPPLTYQWQHEGTNLFAATNALLVITNLTAHHTGGYLAMVSNAIGGFTNSRTATLTVYPAQFKDVTVSAGVTNAPGYCISAAWGDYNNDPFIDLYLAIGANTSSSNALFRNNGNGTFTRIGAAAGPITTDVHDSEGCAWIDINNDGYRDMFVVNGGWAPSRNDFYWNNGDGTFRRGNLGELTELGRYRGWAACADWNGDGWVDIHVGEGTSIWGPYPNCVYQATGLDTFAPVDFAAPEGYVNAGVFGDFDNDVDADLFLSCYTSPSRLWRNDGGGNATAMTNGLPSNAETLHAAWADYDRDGDLDIALSSFSDTRIYRNDGTNGFAVATTLASAIGWPAWADYDNDGHPDLLVTGGQGAPSKAALYRNNGDGTFGRAVDVFTEVANNWLVCPWGDFDNDGFMDVILTHQYGQHRLYRNLGNTNHWLKFKLVGTASNRDAIGAKVRVQATIAGQSVWQMQEVNGGYAMQNDTRLNFGLGDATNVDLVRIEWPSGNVQELIAQSADRIVPVTEQTYISPVRPTASLGGSVTLTRTALAGASYQWRLDGVDLAGQTNQTLSLTNITADMAGRYSVVASNATTLTTNSVYLFVDTQFTKITAGEVVTDNEDSWGSAWADYDLDGDVDLLVANGGFVGNQVNALYRNDGNGVFTRMTAATAGAIVNQPGNWFQAAWADYDNDDLPDAMVSGMSSTALYRNLGQGMFERRLDLVPASWRSGPGPCFADFDRDSWVDWFVGTAVSDNPVRRNSLYRNQSGQAFRAVTTGPIVLDVLADTESGMWGDYDGDGDLDMVITLGFAGPNVRLYENRGGGVFQRAKTTGLEDNLWEGAVPVEAVWGDYDNDTRLDLFVAVYNSTTNVLFHNEGNGVFTKRLMGRRGRQGHPAWADYDNDGWLDLFLARGQVAFEFSQLWHNNGDGTFTEITTGSLVTEAAQSEGAAWGDYDNDGFMDLFVARGYINGRNALYHNNGNSNRWLKVKLEGTASNHSAIGAKVKVQATINGRTFWQMREIPGGNRCQDDLRANFGLGDATIASTVRIEWPSGVVEEFSGIAPRQILTIVEPSLKGAFAQDGKFHLAMTMSTNRVYRLEASSDLVNWTALTNCTGSGSRTPVEFVDPETPAAGAARFYRMK